MFCVVGLGLRLRGLTIQGWLVIIVIRKLLFIVFTLVLRAFTLLYLHYSLQELYHVFGVDEQDVLQKPLLEHFIMFIDIFVEIHGQLIQ